jgi:hypothetical protein
MTKQAVMIGALLSISGHSYAEEAIQESVQVTVEIRVNKDAAEEVVAEAKKDAKALEAKYEPVCGINAVRTVVTRGTQEEQITKSCSSSCKCKCKSCSSGSCCKCKSVQIDDACTCEEHRAEGSRAVCEACQKIKEGNELKRKKQQERELQQQQKRSLKEDHEFCNCQIVQEKCADCGQVNSEFRCNCGKPRQNPEEVVRCNCGGKPKPSQDSEQ